MTIESLRVLLSILMVAVCFTADGENLFDELDIDILTSMSAYHYEIQMSGVQACKENYGYSDDKFSAKLVSLAGKTKNGEWRDMHPCVVSYLMRFGTSNALDYVWNEALHGPDQSGGFEAYALISSFNDETFSLANALYFRDDKISRDRRTSLYSFLCASINPGNEYCGRKITSENRRRILTFLHEKMEGERVDPKYLDEILLTRDPEYGNSDERKRIIASLVESVPTNLPTYAYFRDEYTKLLNSGKEQKEGLSPNGASREAEATQPDEGFWEESKSMALPALAGLVGVAAAVAYLLKRKGR